MTKWISPAPTGVYTQTAGLWEFNCCYNPTLFRILKKIFLYWVSRGNCFPNLLTCLCFCWIFSESKQQIEKDRWTTSRLLYTIESIVSKFYHFTLDFPLASLCLVIRSTFWFYWFLSFVCSNFLNNFLWCIEEMRNIARWCRLLFLILFLFDEILFSNMFLYVDLFMVWEFSCLVDLISYLQQHQQMKNVIFWYRLWIDDKKTNLKSLFQLL